MSQHKKPAKPEVVRLNGKHYDIATDTVRINNQNVTYPVVTEKPNPFTITDLTKLKALLKAINTDGAEGTQRSLSDDVQTIINLVEGRE